jgi:tetratricopeptide (TPR) repeat protein
MPADREAKTASPWPSRAPPGAGDELRAIAYNLTVWCTAPDDAPETALEEWRQATASFGRTSDIQCDSSACFAMFRLRPRSYKPEALQEITSIWLPLVSAAQALGLNCCGLLSSPSLAVVTQRSWVQCALPAELLWARSAFDDLGGEQHDNWNWCDRFELSDPEHGAVSLVASSFARVASTTSAVVRSTVVGRQAERAQLMRYLKAAARGAAAARHPMLVAPAGMGKSTLVAEVVSEAAALGLQCIRTHCVDYATLRRQGPLPRLLLSLFALEAHRADESNIREQVIAASADIQRLDALPVLLDVLDVPLEEEGRSTLSRFDPQQLEAARGEIIAQSVRNAALRAPTLLVVEDLHWASGAVLSCLVEIAKATRDTPLVLVVTSRPSIDPRKTHPELGESLAAIELGPLSSQDARSLATRLARDQRNPWQVHSEEFLDDADINRCLLQAGGNPLYLTQYLHHAASSAHDSASPLTLESLLVQRIDDLEPAPRAVLDVAACIGFYFDAAFALEISGTPPEALGPLEGAGLVVRAEESGHRFVHALIRDAIRSSLADARRQQIHLKLADATTDLLVRAEHWASAGDPRAFGGFVEVASDHREAFRWFHALSALGRAEAVASDDSQLAHAWTAQGEIQEEQGEGQRSLRCFEAALEALARAQVAEDAPASRRARLGVLSAHRLLGQLDEAERTISTLSLRLDGKEERTAMPVGSARLDYLRGSIAFSRGRLDLCAGFHASAITTLEAVGAADEGVDRGEGWTGHRVYAQALSGMGDALYAQGRYSEAADAMQRCVDLARRRGFGRIEVSTLHMLGIATAYTGDWSRGAALARTCWEQACQVGDARATLLSELNVALPCFWGDRAEDALDSCQGGIERAEWIGSAVLMGMTRAFTAHVRLAGGDRPSASRDITLALEHLKTAGERLYGGVCYGAALSLAYADGVATTDTRVGEWLARGADLLSSAVISHNYLYFALGAAPAAFTRHDVGSLSNLLDQLRAFFRSELRACPHGVASAVVAWVALHLEALSVPTGEPVPELWTRVQAQPLLASRVHALGAHP